MFRTYGKPPSSEFLDLLANVPSYFPPSGSDRIRLYGTRNKKLKVMWHDGGISEIAFGQTSSLSQFRNRVINGDFSIWQRGTYFGVFSFPVKTADRFYAIAKGGRADIYKFEVDGWNAYNISVGIPPDITVSSYYFAPFLYAFEGHHLYDVWKSGDSLTVSFYMDSNVSGFFCAALRNFTDLSLGVDSFLYEWEFTTPGTPQKISFSVPPFTFRAPPRNDENLGFILSIGAVAGSFFTTSTVGAWVNGDRFATTNANNTNWARTAGNYLRIWQLQVERGGIPTEFEVIPFDIQFLRCLRYYEKSYHHDVVPGSLTQEGSEWLYLPNLTGDIGFQVRFRVEKRAIPTVRIRSAFDGAPNRIYRDPVGNQVASVDMISKWGFRAFTTANNSAPVNDSFHWEADAEFP